ncbi:molybdopterin converting factor small subunit [Pseudokineococcus lusitanus]|uniref:Molybdopterin converting factor small subunit n=1 Tax=Pseudokineococcus lusitanus TaxID=763993 RepID=A0A3N1HK23_9ACTN|nr:molybdopterin converting factor small subunit [Pseudokineococcus lusitanus]
MTGVTQVTSAVEVAAGAATTGRSARVRVRLFAGAAAAAGTEERLLDVPAEGTGVPTVEDLRRTLVAEHPALGPVLEVATVLVGEVAAEGDAALVVGPQDPAAPPVVDVLPPFAGG